MHPSHYNDLFSLFTRFSHKTLLTFMNKVALFGLRETEKLFLEFENNSHK